MTLRLASTAISSLTRSCSAAICVNSSWPIASTVTSWPVARTVAVRGTIMQESDFAEISAWTDTG
jgi:hypothetical protein